MTSEKGSSRKSPGCLRDPRENHTGWHVFPGTCFRKLGWHVFPGAPHDARRLVFWECAGTHLQQVFDRVLDRSTHSDVWAVIGPEGGLSEREVDALRSQGFARVGLGTALLRVDTAAVVAAALLLDRLDRLA